MLAVSAACAPLELSAAGADVPLPQLKVAYIYNFTRYIEWPARPAGEPFVIAVMGDAVMASALRRLEAQAKQAAGGPIRVSTTSVPDAIRDCQILFVGAGAGTQLGQVLAAARGKPILLVGDTPGFAQRGVAINFFLKRDVLGKGQRLRFEINPAALRGRGLKVSAELYDVAEVLP